VTLCVPVMEGSLFGIPWTSLVIAFSNTGNKKVLLTLESYYKPKELKFLSLKAYGRN
jgi:hypothetical protein